MTLDGTAEATGRPFVPRATKMLPLASGMTASMSLHDDSEASCPRLSNATQGIYIEIGLSLLGNGIGNELV